MLASAIAFVSLTMVVSVLIEEAALRQRDRRRGREQEQVPAE